MATENDDLHTYLRDALLDAASPAAHARFLDNSEFHAAVTLIARVLPKVIDALAEEATQANADMAERVATMHRTLPSEVVANLLEPRLPCPPQAQP